MNPITYDVSILLSENALNLCQSKILLLDTKLKFKAIAENKARKCDLKIDICSQHGIKHCGNKKKYVFQLLLVPQSFYMIISSRLLKVVIRRGFFFFLVRLAVYHWYFGIIFTADNTHHIYFLMFPSSLFLNKICQAIIYFTLSICDIFPSIKHFKTLREMEIHGTCPFLEHLPICHNAFWLGYVYQFIYYKFFFFIQQLSSKNCYTTYRHRYRRYP